MNTCHLATQLHIYKSSSSCPNVIISATVTMFSLHLVRLSLRQGGTERKTMITTTLWEENVCGRKKCE